MAIHLHLNDVIASRITMIPTIIIVIYKQCISSESENDIAYTTSVPDHAIHLATDD